ncbi:hypothetical protein KIN20_004955 [Parelaphostrongylus tenuis]|uniref:Uncharacterized protein n=1 Tax=Parelaphostrongylus tenuis TaxID=148309 RepID=A0AAD5QES4_PARTN|nr:hypothetical protein KIN20_004955 [Parelaphostrongylus tenuis]
MDCEPGDFMCLEKYRKNAAMIQIFYEELNYEILRETPAYTLTSVLADLGGLNWIMDRGFCCESTRDFLTDCFRCSSVRQKKKRISSFIIDVSVGDIRSLHSNHSSRSKQSIVVEDFPPPIQEQIDDESSSGETTGTTSSCRYLPPGEELPCLCKYDSDGHIRVMKALCPVHGFMVRRGYDYSVSNSEEDVGAEVDEVHKEEPYFTEPFVPRRSTKKRKKAKTETGPNGQMSQQNTPVQSSVEP